MKTDQVVTMQEEWLPGSGKIQVSSGSRTGYRGVGEKTRGEENTFWWIDCDFFS